jgi:rhamnosyltransferase subunit B
MARILLAWELGANRGHAVRLATLAKMLRAHDHEIVLAVRRLDVVHAQISDVPIWQAPVSPRMQVGGAMQGNDVRAGMADILARLGMDDPLIVRVMIDGWRRLFSTIRPDLVVGDFAPFLLMAARGRLPSVSVGPGFSAPPETMDSFPALLPNADGVDQAALLATVNAGLAEAGDAPLDALPALFAADRSVVATFTELDPYAAWRTGPLALPDSIDPAVKRGSGEEVFVYLPEMVPADTPLWRGLALSGLKVRVHIALASPKLRDAVAGHGLTIEPYPLPFAEIAGRARLLVSHGGHGFVAAGLAAGLPQVVCHYDLEKLVHGLALARAGLGGHVSLGSIQPRPFADSLVRVHGDEALMARAQAAAPEFLRRGQIPHDDAVREAVHALV